MLTVTFSGLGAGFGAPIIGDWNQFYAAGKTATYKTASNAVYCRKDSANRPVCSGNAEGEAAYAAIRRMQLAADRFINLVTANLEGEKLDLGPNVPPFPIVNVKNPIAKAASIDGLVGPDTRGWISYALTVAGILQRPDAPGVQNGAQVQAAWASPTRNDVMAEYADAIANYLDGISSNFGMLLSAYRERGTPAQTPIDVPETIAFVVQHTKRPVAIAPIVLGAAAMLGATTIGALAAGKKKPGFLYTPSPAFGRRGKLRPRGW